MIKPEELRIGNFVNRLGKKTVITALQKTDELSFISTPISGAITINQIEPIEITEQWLSDFGFEKNDQGNYDNRMELSFVDRKYHFRQGWTDVELNSVHQLQNLYYSLCGKELKLK